MYCKNLSKCLNGKLRCKIKKQVITLDCCKNCLNFILVANKGINKVSKKQKQLNDNRISILTKDFDRCFYCKRLKYQNEKFDLHEVYGGSNRTRSIKMGFVVPLCRKCHSNEEIINKLRIKIQKEFEKNHTREEFINIIGKSYIKEVD